MRNVSFSLTQGFQYFWSVPVRAVHFFTSVLLLPYEYLIILFKIRKCQIRFETGKSIWYRPLLKDLLKAWFTNILKESLNNDGQQFHQYQQYEQSPLTFAHWTQNKTTTYNVWNPFSDLGQAQKCGGVKPFNGILTPPLDN